MIIWNPWHGCRRISEGCDHCYMYYLDGKRGVDTSRVTRTASFDLPLRRDRRGRWKLPSGMELYVGLSTDFFIEEADAWRDEAWSIMRQRPDIAFRILTKRAHRMRRCLAADWGEGYENVMLSVTCENQRQADLRLPLLLDTPARHKGFMAAPFIGPVDASAYLASGQIEEVVCGGENYDGARPCHYEWVESLARQCEHAGASFCFMETGSVFVKDGRTYSIPSKRVQSQQAFRSGLSRDRGKPAFRLSPPPGSIFDLDGAAAAGASHEPTFMEHCADCGSRPVCNGCSGCGRCGL